MQQSLTSNHEAAPPECASNTIAFQERPNRERPISANFVFELGFPLSILSVFALYISRGTPDDRWRLWPARRRRFAAGRTHERELFLEAMA